MYLLWLAKKSQTKLQKNNFQDFNPGNKIKVGNIVGYVANLVCEVILRCAIPVVRLNFMVKWIQSKKHNK